MYVSYFLKDGDQKRPRKGVSHEAERALDLAITVKDVGNGSPTFDYSAETRGNYCDC